MNDAASLFLCACRLFSWMTRSPITENDFPSHVYNVFCERHSFFVSFSSLNDFSFSVNGIHFDVNYFFVSDFPYIGHDTRFLWTAVLVFYKRNSWYLRTHFGFLLTLDWRTCFLGTPSVFCEGLLVFYQCHPFSAKDVGRTALMPISSGRRPPPTAHSIKLNI